MKPTVTSRLTKRANILSTLRNGQPEWTPVVGHVDRYNRPGDSGLPNKIAETAREYGWGASQTDIAYARELDVTIAVSVKHPVAIKHKTCEMESVTDGPDTVTIIHTPHGDLKETVREVTNGAVGYRVEHFMKSPEDIPLMACYFDDEVSSLDADGVKRIDECAKDVGDEGILVCGMPSTPLGILIRFFAGPETTAYLYADAPDALGDLFASMERSYSEQFDLASSTRVDVVNSIDDTSTNTESPAMFRKYCLGYSNRIAEIVKKNGSMYWHHSCGLIRDLLPIYRESKMDAVHAFTEPPTGNVFLDDGRKLLGDKIGIIAGLREMENPLNDRAKAADVVARLFERASAGKRFCLCMTAFQHLTMDDIQWFRAECAKYQ